MFLLNKLVIFSILLLPVLGVTNSYAEPNIKVIRDIAYGDNSAQKLDVYIPPNAQNAPVIFMVHGGAWKIGDKSAKAVVKNKVSFWSKKGFIIVSTNYRLMPEARPIQQAKDVQLALSFSQQKAAKWGGSADRFLLVGHSAGAHLIALISANDKSNEKNAIKPWLGAIYLDSAAYDIVEVMKSKSPPRFYKKAFGEGRVYWQKASPLHQLSSKIPPFLAVCSLKRNDDSCGKAKAFVTKAKTFGTDAQLLPLDASHRKINLELGKDNSYTQSIHHFIMKLQAS